MIKICEKGHITGYKRWVSCGSVAKPAYLPHLTITLTPVDVIALRDGYEVRELDERTCANCGGSDIVMREDEDSSVGYHTTVPWCNSCSGRAD
jgi:hypothetical protein